MTFSDIILEFSKAMLAAGAALGAIWYKNKLDKQKQEKNGDDLIDDYARKSLIKPILDELRYQMNADRVHEWIASNGDTSLSGHHLKKLSMFMESHSGEIEDIAQHFQLIPVQKFSRYVDALSESEDGYVTFYTDPSRDMEEMEAIANKYDMGMRVMFKICSELGKWTGILSVCFERPRKLTEGEIAFCQLQASRIGAVK